jgi:hypothetical protein
MKFTVFWDVLQCSQLDVDQRFKGAYCLHHQGDGLIMEEVRTSETLVNINLTARQYMPEDSKLHTRRRENLKSHTLIMFRVINLPVPE